MSSTESDAYRIRASSERSELGQRLPSLKITSTSPWIVIKVVSILEEDKQFLSGVAVLVDTGHPAKMEGTPGFLKGWGAVLLHSRLQSYSGAWDDNTNALSPGCMEEMNAHAGVRKLTSAKQFRRLVTCRQ